MTRVLRNPPRPLANVRPRRPPPPPEPPPDCLAITLFKRWQAARLEGNAPEADRCIRRLEELAERKKPEDLADDEEDEDD